MLKKLIIVENGNDYQFETLEEIVKELIDKEFYNMNFTDRKNKMKIKALANSLNTPMKIVEDVPNDGHLEGKIIIKNEITYILSLLLMNKITLLERKDSNIFTKNIDKSNLKDNYIIVNKIAKELLKLQI